MARDGSDEEEFRKYSTREQLERYFDTEIETRLEEVQDDRVFYAKEIQQTKLYLEKINETFMSHVNMLRTKLQEAEGRCSVILEENQQICEQDIQEVNRLFMSNQLLSAFKRWQQLKREFQMRKQAITMIPKIPVTIQEINDLFLEQKKSSRSMSSKSEGTNTETTDTSVSITYSINPDENILTEKEKIRQTKEFEEFRVEANHEHDADDDEPRSQPREETKAVRFTPTLSNKSDESTSSNQTGATAEKNPKVSNICFSRRLQELNKSEKNSPSVRPSRSSLLKKFLENNSPRNISSFECRPNLSFLIAATSSDIILFQQSLTVRENYQLGVIRRVTNDTLDLNWHDGPITSMSIINDESLSIFTNTHWFEYNFNSGRKNCHLLKTSTVDDTQTIETSMEKYRRGIGTVHEGFSYQLYLKTNDVWMLMKNRITTRANAGTFQLSLSMPNVQNFLDVTVNDQAICFLVEINNSYAVIFCSLNNCQPDPKFKQIILKDSIEPMKICSGYSNQFRQYLIFVNEPSKKILHILNFEEYLCSYPIDVHSMSYVHDTNELIFVSEKAICSLKFN